MWGGLIGLMFLVPLFGMAIGAATGAAAGKFTDAGVDDDFLKQLGEKLARDGGVDRARRPDTPDKVLERLRPYGGHIIQTSLDNEGGGLARRGACRRGPEERLSSTTLAAIPLQEGGGIAPITPSG